ncbi:MAG TPA: XrtA system polysaccharide deacetylase [Candidatus Krumholzibacteria bacterium]|nr:XrtA system polysaccharide deacetylase [Candidatus Krumholzibacteria bacterium]
MTTNIFTIDVEDWYHGLVPASQWRSCEDRIVDSTRRILDIVDDAGVRTTFFVLGDVADLHPELVQEIAGRGHEVASHGYQHQFIYRQTRAEFQADVARSLASLRAIVSQPVVAYRAPYFSIVRETRWALDVLASLGMRFDSSIFPVHNPRYGIPDARREPHRQESGVVEVPPSTMRIGAFNLPVGGGVYFRVLPSWFLRRAYRDVNREGLPVVFYLHPWEVDPGQPRVRLSPGLRWRHYYGLDSTAARLRDVLRLFPFGPVCELSVP